MPRLPKAKRLAADLSAELGALEAVAATRASLPYNAQARLLEIVFVKGFTEFEWFLEQLFFDLLTGAAKVDESRPKMRIRDPEIARSMTGSDEERYLKWLPLDNTVDRASRWLVEGQPFVRLASRSSIRADLKRAQEVRNATAHKSPAALAKFKRQTNDRFTTVGDYLASASGGKTVCEALLDDFNRYGLALVGTSAEAERRLGPSDALRTGARHAAGSFRCQSCTAVYAVGETQPLSCSVCDPPCSHCGRRPKTAEFRLVVVTAAS